MQQGASGAATQALLTLLRPLAALALNTSTPRLVECGFLTSLPGALAQAFHADTAPDALRTCEASALKVQLALVEVGAELGPLEVVPWTQPAGVHQRVQHGEWPLHVPARGISHAGWREAEGGEEAMEPAAVATRLLVSPGDVTVYASNMLHRGSANRGDQPRPTFQLTLIGDGAAPTGVPYTMLVDDVIALHSRRGRYE